jgi:hypothetical protein
MVDFLCGKSEWSMWCLLLAISIAFPVFFIFTVPIFLIWLIAR